VRPGLFADETEVRGAIDDDRVVVVDTMMPEHFRGDIAMYARPGHIPGAVNIPTVGLIGEDGRFHAPDVGALAERDRATRVITYCGGGIAAAGGALALHQLGFTDVAVYSPSLQEWAANPDNPLSVGDA
jgi:thiosulfate/3-mercaptopyruvate sulfurtransferase